MDTKYVKAVKAGLLGALLIIVIYLVTYMLFYFVATLPFNQNWGATEGHPDAAHIQQREAWSQKFDIGLDILLVFAYILIGLLSTWYIIPYAKGIKNIVILGAASGVIAQLISIPFKIVMMTFNIHGFVNLDYFITTFLLLIVHSNISDYVISLIMAIVLVAISSLISGMLIKKYMKPKIVYENENLFKSDINKSANVTNPLSSSGLSIPVWYGGLLIRFFAYIIDDIISTILTVVLAFVFVNIILDLDKSGFKMYHEPFIWIAAIVIMAIIILYYSFFESSKYQATPGKMIFGLKVTDMNGNRISIDKAIIRNIVKTISTIILYISVITIAFTKKKQGLHDFAADTIVIYK